LKSQPKADVHTLKESLVSDRQQLANRGHSIAIKNPHLAGLCRSSRLDQALRRNQLRPATEGSNCLRGQSQ
jgi:hypothetical protein